MIVIHLDGIVHGHLLAQETPVMVIGPLELLDPSEEAFMVG